MATRVRLYVVTIFLMACNTVLASPNGGVGCFGFDFVRRYPSLNDGGQAFASTVNNVLQGKAGIGRVDGKLSDKQKRAKKFFTRMLKGKNDEVRSYKDGLKVLKLAVEFVPALASQRSNEFQDAYNSVVHGSSAAEAEQLYWFALIFAIGQVGVVDKDYNLAAQSLHSAAARGNFAAYKLLRFMTRLR